MQDHQNQRQRNAILVGKNYPKTYEIPTTKPMNQDYTAQDFAKAFRMMALILEDMSDNPEVDKFIEECRKRHDLVAMVDKCREMSNEDNELEDIISHFKL